MVSTQEFWECMCKPEFIRIDLHSGRMRGDIIKTVVAPEEIDGFIDHEIDMLIDPVESMMCR